MKNVCRPAIVLLALAAVIGVACDDDDGSARVAPSATATIAGPPVEFTPAASQSPTAAPSGVPRTYRYSVEMTFGIVGAGNEFGFDIEGSYAAPDSHRFRNRFSLGVIAGSEETTIIADRAWMREGTGDYEAVPVDGIDTSLTSADPEFIIDAAFLRSISKLESTADTVDGRAARRYELGLDDFAGILEFMGESFIENIADVDEFRMAVWVDTEYPMILRAEVEAAAPPDVFDVEGVIEADFGDTIRSSIRVDVTAVDDPNINIQPPIE